MEWIEEWRVQRAALVPVSGGSELSVRYHAVWVIMRGGGCTVARTVSTGSLLEEVEGEGDGV